MISPALIVLVCCLGQQGKPPQFFNQAAVKMMTYYQSGDPNQGREFLRDLLKPENINDPWFANQEHVHQMMGAQLGDIAIGNTNIVREYESKFSQTTVIGKRILLRALWNCGDEQTVKVVNDWLADNSNAPVKSSLAELKARLSSSHRKHIRNLSAKTPEELDFLWTNFFVTGEYEPISRILDAVDQQPADGHPALQQAATWSLRSNLRQHPWLVKIVGDRKEERKGQSKKLIDDALANASIDEAMRSKFAQLQARQKIIGKWIADGDAKPSIEFFANGNVRIAHPADDKWWIGTFKLKDTTRIESQTVLGGATLGSHWRIEGETLVAPRGPNPRVIWTKSPAEKSSNRIN